MTSGVLVLDKPEGPTSHDMVQFARRLLGTRQVGHTGTLDPMATGVLVLCVGRATRLARFLTASRKVYRARIRCGWETDTLDRTGRALAEPRPARPTAEDVERALADLTGRQMQTPPSFSAKRIGGVRAHALARAGSAAEPRPVEVEIDEFREVRVSGSDIDLEVRCSAGTYIRSLARDLGRALGTGAHLQQLRRTVSGEFGLEVARTPEALRALGRSGARSALVPLRDLQLGLPAVDVAGSAVADVAHGRALAVGAWIGGPPAPGGRRLLGPDGELLAVGTVEPGPGGMRLRPRVVLLRPEEVDGRNQLR
jgi:tRNA pseudouridine55 synthase